MMLVALAVIAVLLSLGVAALERRDGRGIERTFRGHLAQQLHAAQIRNAQLELMLDSRRALEQELITPQERDAHLIVSGPTLAAPGRSTSSAAPAPGTLSIDALPATLRDEVRALEGDDVQREYLETIQNELANGADVDELHSRLFGD